MALIKFSKEKENISLPEKKSTPVDLSRMQEGYKVDFGGDTYSVTSYAEFDWGEGFITQSWELSSPSGIKYLERETGDDIYWILSDKIEDNEISDLYDHLRKNEDAPEIVKLFNQEFILTDSGAGIFCKNGKRPGKECVLWSYTDEKNHIFISIYQWGDKLFTCYMGSLVEEKQFTNIEIKEKQK